MSKYAHNAIYGDQGGAEITATMLNPDAQGETDWGAVLAGGIRGAAQAAISASAGSSYRDGQLVTRQQVQQKQTHTLIILAVIAYMVFK